MSNPTANDLPQDIATKMNEYFWDEENKLVTIVQFFTNPASQLCTPRYFQILRSVGNDEDAFRMIVDWLVEDLEKNTDPLDKILDEIRKHLKGSHDYIRILKSVSNDEKTFHAIVDELAEDLEKTHMDFLNTSWTKLLNTWLFQMPAKTSWLTSCDSFQITMTR